MRIFVVVIMEKKKATNKRPDQVVYNEDSQRYDAAIKAYGTNVGAPQIDMPDVSGWKSTQIHKANKHLKTKYLSIKAEYEALMEVMEYNELVTNAKFSFEPIIGEVYYLYKNAEEDPFLSIIDPNSCDFVFLGSFRLTSDYLWEKVSQDQSLRLKE